MWRCSWTLWRIDVLWNSRQAGTVGVGQRDGGENFRRFLTFHGSPEAPKSNRWTRHTRQTAGSWWVPN